jgi:hypothetical protein
MTHPSKKPKAAKAYEVHPGYDPGCRHPECEFRDSCLYASCRRQKKTNGMVITPFPRWPDHEVARIEKEFEEKLEAALDEGFPKIHDEGPEKKANKRGEALSLYAAAVLAFRAALDSLRLPKKKLSGKIKR